VVGYPILQRPAPFTRPREHWSKADAREVLVWLVALIEPRTDHLLQLLGMSWSERPTDWLDRMEAGIPKRIWSDAFWEPSRGSETIELRGHMIQHDPGDSLSGLGEALGADLGLVLARSFSNELGDARWVVGAHGRTSVSNNLPILKGRGRAEFDPLLIGLNVARRFLPDHIASPQQLGLADLHAWWLASLADPSWGTVGGRPA
jgi:hypothetical protein